MTVWLVNYSWNLCLWQIDQACVSLYIWLVCFFRFLLVQFLTLFDLNFWSHRMFRRSPSSNSKYVTQPFVSGIKVKKGYFFFILYKIFRLNNVSATLHGFWARLTILWEGTEPAQLLHPETLLNAIRPTTSSSEQHERRWQGGSWSHSVPCQPNCLRFALAPMPGSSDHARRVNKGVGCFPRVVQPGGTVPMPGISDGLCHGKRAAADSGSGTDPVTISLPSCILGAVSWQVENRVLETQKSVRIWMRFHQNGCSSRRRCVPMFCNASKLTYHPGINYTLQFLRQRFWWPSITPGTT